MTDLAPAVPSEPTRLTAERYFGLVEAGVLSEEDRVELLEGVVVAMTPSNPPHAAGVARATEALFLAVARRAHIRPQLSLVLGRYSVPEPDLAVVAGRAADYDASHPKTALLVIEVSDASLAQDRLTKAAIYAAAGIPEYWIVNLRDGVVEVMREPDPAQARWHEVRRVGRDARLELVALPGASVAVADLLPERDTRR
jgi:Uma2 family endonuclease